MYRSRSLWILVIALVCFAGILTWESPHTVLSAITHPGYSDSPRATIQHFWNLLDTRQLNLAREIILEPMSPETSSEFQLWADRLTNPLLSLQKVEFLENNSENIIARATWVLPPNTVKIFKYSFTLKTSETGWKIQTFKRLP